MYGHGNRQVPCLLGIVVIGQVLVPPMGSIPSMMLNECISSPERKRGQLPYFFKSVFLPSRHGYFFPCPGFLFPYGRLKHAPQVRKHAIRCDGVWGESGSDASVFSRRPFRPPPFGHLLVGPQHGISERPASGVCQEPESTRSSRMASRCRRRRLSGDRSAPLRR